MWGDRLLGGIWLFLYHISLRLQRVGHEIGLNLSHAITDILSFLVMIELFRSFIEYFKARRIRLHSMIDPAILQTCRPAPLAVPWESGAVLFDTRPIEHH